MILVTAEYGGYNLAEIEVCEGYNLLFYSILMMMTRMRVKKMTMSVRQIVWATQKMKLN